MLFENLDINSSPALKELCKTIVRNFLKTHKGFEFEKEYNVLRDYICVYINDMNQEIKKTIMYSFSIICYNNYYTSILEKINNNYDGEPLIVICYDMIINNYLDILFVILDDIAIQYN
jgi:hypothetical protein